jgi:hypothetical protein
MAFEFHFQIDPNRISVQDVHTGYRLEASTRVVYRRKDGKILALGETEEEVHTRLGGFYEREESEIHSTVLFSADGAQLPYEIQMMVNFARLLHRQSQHARPTAYFFTKLFDGFDYFLTIPDYDSFPEVRRNNLEQRLQGHLRLRRLMINGREVQIPLWKRNLEFWIRRMFFLVIPLAVTVIGYLIIPTVFTTSPLLFLAYLLAITYFFHYIGKILWMLLAPLLVPYAYRLCMLQGLRSRLSRGSRFLVKVLWGLASCD